MRPCKITKVVEDIAHRSSELLRIGPNRNPEPRLVEGRLMANSLLHALGEKGLDVENTTSLEGQMILELRSDKRMKRQAKSMRRLCGENESNFLGHNECVKAAGHQFVSKIIEYTSYYR